MNIVSYQWIYRIIALKSPLMMTTTKINARSHRGRKLIRAPDTSRRQTPIAHVHSVRVWPSCGQERAVPPIAAFRSPEWTNRRNAFLCVSFFFWTEHHQKTAMCPKMFKLINATCLLFCVYVVSATGTEKPEEILTWGKLTVKTCKYINKKST